MTKLSVTLTGLLKGVVYLNLVFSAINMAIAIYTGSGANFLAALLGLGGACLLAWIAKGIS